MAPIKGFLSSIVESTAKNELRGGYLTKVGSVVRRDEVLELMRERAIVVEFVSLVFKTLMICALYP